LNDIQKDIDVLFIGSMTPRRAEVLQALSDKNILITKSFGPEMVRLINRAKIVLNIHAEDAVDTETRVYEVLGCGTFLLSEQLSMENPFDSGELVLFKSIAELKELLNYFLTHEDEREAIAEKGHEEALRSHTYKHRAMQIIDIFNKKIISSNDRQQTIRKDILISIKSFFDYTKFLLPDTFQRIMNHILK
jgi:glycosyltransferase involved in cell wall biosynthesis